MRRSPRSPLFLSVAVGLAVLTVASVPLAPVALAQTAPAPIESLDDWGAFGRIEKQVKEMEPQAAIDAWRKLYESRPNILPQVGMNITTKIGDLYADKLDNKEKTLEIDDWAIKKYSAEPPVVVLIQQKSKTLLALKRHEEAAKVVEDNWDAVVRAGTSGEDWLIMYAGTTLRDASDAYTALGQPEKAVPLIIKGFSAIPALLDDKAQGQGGWRNGWMYGVLVPQLLKAGKADEALSWAKLHYALCSFDKDCIARANTSLGRVWGAQENYPAIRIFAQIQEEDADPTLKNPLSAVKAPDLDEKLMKEHVARISVAPKPGEKLKREKSKEAITVLLAKGEFATAMNEARRLMKDDPNNPGGALQICRVFKAGDLSTRRANQFLLYLEGKAENPIPPFMKEYEKPATPGEAPATAPATATPPAAPPAPAPAAPKPDNVP